jgi:tellurite resistance protein TehA-like permease
MKFRWVIIFVLVAALCVAAANVIEHPSSSSTDILMWGLKGAAYAIAYLGLTVAVLAPLVWLLRRKRAKDAEKKD